MPKPIASLSLDLDNKWAYLRTLGPGRWEDYPCYLDLVTPRIVDAVRRFDLGMTVFVVGKDLETDPGRESVCRLAEVGCEIGNHTYNHYPWLHTLAPEVQRREIVDAEEAIHRVVGAAPRGFRGPGFSCSEQLLGMLAERGYAYDSSSLPAITAPLARLYCSVNSLWTSGPRGQMFGSWTDGFRPLRPHRIDTPHGPLTEAPVTTMPLLRTPIHMTYLMHLSQLSPAAAWAYARAALWLCQTRGVAPLILLHPLDFLGGEDCPELAFFPGMRSSRQQKSSLLTRVLGLLVDTFRVVTVEQHTAKLGACSGRHDERLAEGLAASASPGVEL